MELAHCCLILLLISMPQATPQSTTPQTPPQQSPPPAEQPQAGTVKIDLPVDLDRIQRALANTPKLRFDESNRPVFRVQVFGEKPTIDDILGPDWAKGPVPHGGMTHQEFLDLVTPTEELTAYAAISNKERASVAAASFLLQWTLQRAIRKYDESRDERERAAARQEVIEALNALEEARVKAGMPPK